jgi:hypothetical protein
MLFARSAYLAYPAYLQVGKIVGHFPTRLIPVAEITTGGLEIAPCLSKYFEVASHIPVKPVFPRYLALSEAQSHRILRHPPWLHKL